MLLWIEVVILVIIVVVATGAEMAPVCPKACDCNDILLTVNCSGIGLKRIPDTLPSNYRLFNFDNNMLSVIEEDDLVGIVKTRYLSLSRCNITKIQEGAFRSVYNLSELYLAGNRLNAVPREIRNLSRLQLLDMSDNSIDRLAKHSFTGMTKLQRLLLDNNNITILAKGCMTDADRLRVLSLRNNGLHTVKSGTFHCLDNLEELYLSDNTLSSLPYGWLVGLSNLRLLDLRRSYSANVVYDQLPDGNSTKGWFFPGLSRLLDTLDLAENGITRLEYNAFLPLEEMTRLDLSVNQISDLPLGVFSRQKKLQRLDLSYNLLTNLTDVLFMEGAALEYFDLGNNLFEVLVSEPFKNMEKLQFLSLQRNVLYDIEFLLKVSLPNLQELNLASNTINNVSKIGLTSFQNLRRLNLKKNRLVEVPNVRNLTFLTNLDLSWNGITYVPYDAFQGTNLREIDLQNNNIITLDERTLMDLPRLGAVRVGNNPWKCDCEIKWFGEASMNQEWGRDLDTAICDWPPSMKHTMVVTQDRDVQCTTYPPPVSVIVLVVIWIVILLIVATAILLRTYKIHRIRKRRRNKEGDNEPSQVDQQQQPPPKKPEPVKGKGKGKVKPPIGQLIEMKDRKPLNGLKVKPFDREFYV
ncbi:toll-like receptor 6 [Asterias rubens]|uniref:toll-like receptor 6 n=1 Tax=Asterias rubens TaxID=7604 RepID=UPI00145565DA|nr:toll-like receptor 6 [Asterias rubens]